MVLANALNARMVTTSVMVYVMPVLKDVLNVVPLSALNAVINITLIVIMCVKNALISLIIVLNALMSLVFAKNAMIPIILMVTLYANYVKLVIALNVILMACVLFVKKTITLPPSELVSSAKKKIVQNVKMVVLVNVLNVMVVFILILMVIVWHALPHVETVLLLPPIAQAVKIILII